MEIKDMYRAVNKDFDWGFTAYQMPKKYYGSRSLSPPEKSKKIKIHLENEYKGVKKTYLDTQLRLLKDIPGPNTYNISRDWSAGFIKKPDHLKQDDKSNKGLSSRETLFDTIIRKGDKEKPGPGSYFETKTPIEELKEKSELLKTNSVLRYIDRKRILNKRLVI